MPIRKVWKPANQQITKTGTARKQAKNQYKWKVRRTMGARVANQPLTSKTKFRKRMKKHGGLEGELTKMKRKTGY